MAAPEANQIGLRIVFIDEEYHIKEFDGATNIVEIERKSLIMFCPKCCIPVMTVVNKKVNEGCCITICTFFTELCWKLVLFVFTLGFTCGLCGIVETKCRWSNEADGFWKYVHFCPMCRFEIATYKPRDGCIEKCGVCMLLVLIILGIIMFFVIKANSGKF